MITVKNTRTIDSSIQRGYQAGGHSKNDFQTADINFTYNAVSF
jgi:hypothetical protein